MLLFPAARPRHACPDRVPANLVPFAFLILLLAGALVSTGCAGGTASGATPNSSAAANGLNVSSSLPSATVGASYDAALSVSGGTAPYRFSMKSGQLPAGVQFGDTNGTFTGTPSAVGNFNFSVSVQDANGLSKQQSLQLAVVNSNSNSGGNSGTLANSFRNLQQSAGWAAFGQGPPNFIDCSPSPCDGITFSFQQGINSPSISGSAAQFNLGGTAVYTDALFNNHLIGALSSQSLPDDDHTLVPSYHSFSYDVYFYSDTLDLSQAVEFDMNQFFNSQGFIWGHECRIAGGHEWDIWDNVNAHWVPTGIPCNPVNQSWNHVTIQVQRTADNQLFYQSITLNGVTSPVNDYYSPGPAPSNWYGITVNYQMDGNSQQSPYSVYLDSLTFSYE